MIAVLLPLQKDNTWLEIVPLRICTKTESHVIYQAGFGESVF